jgi:hypothetical protein
MNFWSALGTVLVGMYTANKAVGLATEKIEEWFKFIASITGTVSVVFPVIWGSGTIAHYNSGQSIGVALGLGFAEGLVATGVSIGFLWTRSSLTRGIPICWPMKVSQEMAKVSGFNYIEPVSKK